MHQVKFGLLLPTGHYSQSRAAPDSADPNGFFSIRSTIILKRGFCQWRRSYDFCTSLLGAISAVALSSTTGAETYRSKSRIDKCPLSCAPLLTRPQSSYPPRNDLYLPCPSPV